MYHTEKLKQQEEGCVFRISPVVAAPLFQGRQDAMLKALLCGAQSRVYGALRQQDAESTVQEQKAQMDEDTGRIPLLNLQKEPASLFSAMALIGDFCYFAGEPEPALLKALSKKEICRSGYLILIPPDDAWAELMEESLLRQIKKRIRYAVKCPKEGFDKQRLFGFLNALPKNFELRQIDRELYEKVLREETDWAGDLVGQFLSYEDFKAHGIGFGIIEKDSGRLLSGASTYAWYPGGIEIEIDTHPDHRRKGLAMAAAAKLILACEERGIEPGWDAHTKLSLKLSEKLGYRFDYEYPVYDFEPSEAAESCL